MSAKIQSAPRTKDQRRMLRGMRKVWRKAKPGMKVRCTYGLSGFPGIRGPYDGDVYTIRELRRGLYNTWALGFTLIEIVNEIDSEQGSEPFFSADCFEILDGSG